MCDELLLLFHSEKEIKNPCLTKRARIIYSVCASPDLEDGLGGIEGERGGRLEGGLNFFPAAAAENSSEVCTIIRSR